MTLSFPNTLIRQFDIIIIWQMNLISHQPYNLLQMYQSMYVRTY